MEAASNYVCLLASPTNEKSFLIAEAFILHHFTLKEFKPQVRACVK